jgi:hypothetical protein
MKKIIIISTIALAVIFITVHPCFAKKFLNTPFLEKVERTPQIDANTGKTIENKTTYKDSIIAVTWNPDSNGLYFELTNQSGNEFNIVWTECYINDSINKYTVIHEEVKYLREMPPTGLGPGKKLEDFLYPSAFVKFEHGGRISTIRYKEIYKKKLKESEAAPGAFTAQTLTATLTLDDGNTHYVYDFHFKTEVVEK